MLVIWYSGTWPTQRHIPLPEQSLLQSSNYKVRDVMHADTLSTLHACVRADG